MGVDGDELHLVRVALAELKKGADLAVSNKASLLVIGGVWRVLCLVQKAGWGVRALACRRAFEKTNFMSWTGMLTTHVAASKSRSWASVF